MMYREIMAEIVKFRTEHPSATAGRVLELPDSHFDWTEEHIPLLVEGFYEFRGEYFRTDRREPFALPPFQRVWTEKILTALITGGREMILAPVRHGKTELLKHICQYMWILDPNIRVLWVSVTAGVAKDTTSLMRLDFMNNDQLIRDHAPGGTFVPDRYSPHRWTNEEFTLATRVDRIKGPNLKTFGRGTTIVGQNADIIIVDDPEDGDAVAQLATRQATKKWWANDVGGRQVDDTGVFVIGSRQHPNDLYSLILRSPGWGVTVEQAHDPLCAVEGEETDPISGHWECLLWPEFRSYAWLRQRKAEMDEVNPAYFDMVYQNLARSDGFVVFDEKVVTACRSATYTAKEIPKPTTGRIELVAGLDPSISGFQAAVLLAYQIDPELRIWLVDLDNTEGSGTGAIAKLIERWYKDYGLTAWRIEENTYGQVSHRFKEISDVTSRHGIFIEDWHTGTNKNSQFFGVTSLAKLFIDKTIILPYIDPYSRAITDKLIRQLTTWDESNSRNKNRTGVKDDLVMAFWFAWGAIRRANQNQDTEAVISHEGYDGFGFDYAPWEEMAV